MIPYPIPYQGSKRRLAHAIVACFPRDTINLIEPFAGSAAVSLAAAYFDKSKYIILNDINVPLMELWDRIINQPRQIAEEYKKLWKSQEGKERRFYDFIRDKFNKTHRPQYLLYLLSRCVKASVRYNSNGQMNQSSDNRRKGMHPDKKFRHILQASKLLKGKVALMSEDYRISLELAGTSDIVYMDPPYQGVSGDRDQRYVKGLLFDDFVESLDSLNNKKISFIVSYDGRTGNKQFGKYLPRSLALKRIEIEAGKSTQATLLGRVSKTYESLYLSDALMERIKEIPQLLPGSSQQQLFSFKVSTYGYKHSLRAIRDVREQGRKKKSGFLIN